MKQIKLTKVGGYEALQTIITGDDLIPGKNQVLVKVKSCGFNFYDIYIRQGLSPDIKPPCILGLECAGVITQIGDLVHDLEEGDHVIVNCPDGGAMSDYVVAESTRVLKVPRTMQDFDSLAALTINYLTAYFTLVSQARIKGGDSILIHGAAGGVGWAATQIAKLFPDVLIFGTSSSTKHEAIKENGVDYAFTYDQDLEMEIRKICPEGITLVLESMSGHSLAKSMDLLHPLGKMIIIGCKNMISGETRSWLSILRTWLRAKDINPSELIMKNHSVAGFNLKTFEKQFPSKFLEGWKQILVWLQEGKILPRIDSVFDFNGIAEASERLIRRKNIGKVILRPE